MAFETIRGWLIYLFLALNGLTHLIGIAFALKNTCDSSMFSESKLVYKETLILFPLQTLIAAEV